MGWCSGECIPINEPRNQSRKSYSIWPLVISITIVPFSMLFLSLFICIKKYSVSTYEGRGKLEKTCIWPKKEPSHQKYLRTRLFLWFNTFSCEERLNLIDTLTHQSFFNDYFLSKISLHMTCDIYFCASFYVYYLFSSKINIH